MLNIVLIFFSQRGPRVILSANLGIAVLALPLFLLLLLPLYCTSALAAQTVLQDIKITSKDNNTEIDVDLGVPLEYVKHFPQAFGEIVQIQLKLGQTLDREIHKEVRQGSELQPDSGGKPLLIYVTYEEGVPGGPYLTLRFVKPVRFRVDAQKSLTTLSIVVFGEEPTVAQLPQLTDKPGNDQAAQTPSRATQPIKQDSDLGQLMAKARQALTFHDNEGAIRLLRQIISVSGNPHEQDARELLGLALERTGQIPRAKFEYKKYLEIYKEGAGPTRVRQRLTALENIGGIERRQKLRVAKRSRRAEEFKVFGRLSQDYSVRTVELNSDVDPTDNETTILGTVVRSQRVGTYGSVRSRYRNDNRVVQAVFAGNYNYGTEKYDRTEGRISDLFLDWDETAWGLKAVVGRQRSTSSGVLDRYDGVDLSYRLFEGFTPHILAGQNVTFYDWGYKKNFTAVRTQLGKRKSKLTGNLYAESQKVDNLTDRQAVGGDFRYSAGAHSFFGGADYDVYFKKVNLMDFRWGWQLTQRSRVNLSYDYRKYMLFTNALSGLYVNSRILRVDELMRIFSEERAKELAINRSGESTSVTIGSSYQLEKTQQLTFDLSFYRYAATESFNFTESENQNYKDIADTTAQPIAYYPGSTSYNVTAQFIANGWLAPQDLHIIGLRYNKYSGYYNDYSLFWNGRLPSWFNWNPRPRINVGYRKNTGGSNVVVQGDRVLFSPSLKLDHRWKKAWVTEVELGFDGYYYLVDHNSSTAQDQRGWFFRMGYYYNF